MKKTLYTVITSVLVFGCYFFSISLARELIQIPAFDRMFVGFWSDELCARVLFFYSLIAFFVLNEYVTLRNKTLKESFVNYTDNKCGIKQILKFTLSQTDFWCGYAIYAVVFSVVSNAPIKYELEMGYDAGWVLIPLTLLLTFILYTLTRFLTVKFWARSTKRELNISLSIEPSIKLVIKFLVGLLLTTVLILFAGALLGIVYPMLSTMLSIVKIGFLPFVIILAICILAIYFIRHIHAVFLRVNLINSIKKQCSECGYSFSYRKVFLSVFFYVSGYNLRIDTGDKIYAIRLIKGLKKLDPLYFDDEGFLSVEKHYIYFKHYSSEYYQFESEGNVKKILLACPCPSQAFIKQGREEKLLDYGDSFFGYSFYNLSGFLNDLKYGCIR